jgi:phospholipid-binding lipoprotein MlaA
MKSKGIESLIKKSVMALCFLLIAAAVAATAGCSTIQSQVSSRQLRQTASESTDELADEDFALLEKELEEEMVDVNDPIEPLNRLMFGLNDTLYFWVFKPVAQTYKDITPEPARIGIRNFFQNITTPGRYINCLLQGKGEEAGTELDRFLINTTEGILGFGDPALDKHGIKPVDEDLGQTLATIGFKDGFYLVLPLLGPSNLRDADGKFGDAFLNPVRYVEPCEAAAGITATRIVNNGSFRIGEYEDFKVSAVDPYIAMRQAYTQYRRKQIQE